jgi:hypothetical protein
MTDFHGTFCTDMRLLFFRFSAHIKDRLDREKLIQGMVIKDAAEKPDGF